MVASLALVALVYCLGVFLTLPVLKRSKRPRDYWVFFLLIGCAFALSVAVIAVPDKVPNPNDLINHLVSGFGKRFFSP